MSILKKIISHFDNKEKINMEFNGYINFSYKVNPYIEALKIALIYGVFGALWIVLSDNLLVAIVRDPFRYKIFQTYKGWFYVFTTTILIFFLILNKLMLFNKAITKIYENYEELNLTHEELVALEEELRQQFEELEGHRRALLESEQRYEIAVEGANDGIWDWDLKNNIYFFSDKWKRYLGYEDFELDNSFETWKGLLHPEDREKAIRKINAYILSQSGIYENTYRFRRKDGEYRWILSKGKGIWDEDGICRRVAGSHTDITERKLEQEKLQILAYTDALTGLSNRVEFEIKVTDLIESRKNMDSKFALVYIDIDNFKNINDTLGHNTGDLLLKYIGNILKHQVKNPDFVARLSGDEFAIVLDNVSSNDEITEKIDDLLRNLRIPWVSQEQKFFISYSMGIAIYPEHGKDLSSLLKNADNAMFSVKKREKDNYSFYTSEMQEEALKHITMVSELRHAIENGEFTLFYQPIVDLNTKKIIGVEALIRWIHPTKGIISPMEFIPLAEETGCIKEIGRWVLKSALLQKKKWINQGYIDLKMSINLSAKRVTKDNLVDEIKNLLLSMDMECNNIQLEVTETAVFEDIKLSTKVLKQLKDMGIQIALDDFGTGYSSLTYLKDLPINVVKMDKEFIKSVSNKGRNNAIVNSVIQLSHDLGMKVVAEGVETENQLSFLENHGCDFGQGYLFSRAVPPEEVEKILKFENFYQNDKKQQIYTFDNDILR